MTVTGMANPVPVEVQPSVTDDALVVLQIEPVVPGAFIGRPFKRDTVMVGNGKMGLPVVILVSVAVFVTVDFFKRPNTQLAVLAGKYSFAVTTVLLTKPSAVVAVICVGLPYNWLSPAVRLYW